MKDTDIKEEIINGVHILIPIIVMSFVLFPVKILKYIWFLPAFFYPFWWICDGCFLTKISKKHRKNNNWALDQMKNILTRMQKKKIVGILLVYGFV